MRPLLLVGILSSFICVGAAPQHDGDGDAPQMVTISAKAAKPGDVIEITGVGLDPAKVDEIYLTDNKFDMKVKVLEQKDTAVKLRVPPFAKPGRMQLLLLTKGDDAKLLEQPLYLLIEDPTTTEVTQVKKPEETKTDDHAAPPKQEKNQ